MGGRSGVCIYRMVTLRLFPSHRLRSLLLAHLLNHPIQPYCWLEARQETKPAAQPHSWHEARQETTPAAQPYTWHEARQEKQPAAQPHTWLRRGRSGGKAASQSCSLRCWLFDGRWPPSAGFCAIQSEVRSTGR